jgi:hypothetical protein
MWRSVLAGVLVFACGHPSLEGYRPQALNRPLQGFYAEVQKAAESGKQVIANFDNERYLFYVKVFVRKVETELRSGSRGEASKRP